MTVRVSEGNSRIAKNTIYLYIRMFITILVSLYTSRVVLSVLGASDFGLYSVVAGVLTMFAMFNGALTTGTQRFFNYAMGEESEVKLKKTFSITFTLHVIVAFCVFVIGQTVGYWFVVNYLNIPDGRMIAAIWVYELSLFAFVISLVQIPFQSCIIAHEHMNIYAYMSIYDVVMKLLIIFLVQILTADKLILYAILLFVVSTSSVIIYTIYCWRHYNECRFKMVSDKEMMKNIATYSGWNLLGGSIGPITNQGCNIIINVFCGTIVNAAWGLTSTVSNYVMQFVTNFQMAANPQIVKLFAAKELERFYRLIVNNCRVSVYLYLLIAIPVFIEIDFVLLSWLGDYPKYTDVFVRIILFQSFFQSINRPINMSVHASGNIKWMNISNTIFMLIVLPSSYFILKMDYSPVIICWINVLFFITDNMVCLYFSHKYTDLPVKTILVNVYLNAIVGGIIMFIVPYIISLQIVEGFARFFVIGGVSIITSIIVFYFWGMTPGMKAMVQDKIRILYPHKTDRAE